MGHAVPIWQPQIEQDEVGRAQRGLKQAIFRGRGFERGVAFVLQGQAQGAAHGGLVFDHQHQVL